MSLRALPLAFPIVAAALLFPGAAEAAPPQTGTSTRAVVLGPADLPIVKRLERNLTAMRFEVLTATVTLCTRDVVTRLFKELGADMALCADRDAVGVWTKEDDRVALKEVVVARGTDDRSQELDAARASMLLRGLPKDGSRKEPSGFTIVANGPAGSSSPGSTGSTSSAITDSGSSGSSSSSSSASPVTFATDNPPKDAPAPTPSHPPPPVTRYAPRAVLGLGPALMASRDGGSFAISGEIEVGVSRYVALVPWFMFLPAARTAETVEGSATYRPTLFGLGFGVPLLPTTSTVIPRIGCGYSMLWMHVTPESARAPNTKSPDSEDLLAPVFYVNAAASVKITGNFRITGEGMFGTSSHDLVVRIARQSTAHWGVPLASLALRGEWVIP